MQDDWELGTGVTDPDVQWQDGDFVLSRPDRKRFHLSLFIYALLGGALGALSGLAIYNCMYNPSGSNVMMVGLIMAVISALILLACSLCELFRPRITMNQELNLRSILLGLLVAAAVFVAGCLCEFLYEMNMAIEFSDYVFAIDDSGSMSTTDPQKLRYSALAELLDSMDEDKRVGLVRFNEGVYVPPVDLGALDEEQRTRLSENIANPYSDGGTDIHGALKASLELYRNNAQTGRFPVIVLLSDGYSETSLDGIERDFLDAGVAISTVSLGSNTDEALLKNLAQATGGQYIKVEQAGDLAQAFQHVSTAMTYRCLFSPRPGIQRGNILYMVLRVLFLLLPGLIIGFFILLLLQNGNATRQLFISGVTGLLAGLVMEVGTFFLLPLAVTQIVSWLLYSIVLLQYNDNASGIRQTGLDEINVGAGLGDVGDIWGGFPKEPTHSTGKISRRNGQNSGRIDHGNDWGRL